VLYASLQRRLEVADAAGEVHRDASEGLTGTPEF